MKTQKLKNAIVLSVTLACTLASSFANAGCGFYDRGSPHADDGDWTKFISKTQANGTWNDWVWRGSSQNEVAFCPWGATKPCQYNWGQSKLVGVSTTQGFSVGGAGSVGSVGLSAAYNKQWTRYSEANISFNYIVEHARGTYIEPIVVQKRRWRQGVLRGGWVLASTQEDRGRTWNCYDFNSNIEFGRWNDNKAEGSAYRSFHIHK